MPGAKNRTKGNVKPSSSSQAARLLAETGAAPTGFIGFGSGGGGGIAAYVPACETFDDADSTLDSDFRMILRKLTKRDSTTKIKALGEFGVLCQEKDDACLVAILPFWPRIYNKMAMDVDHKVRESAQTAMAALVGRVGRNLAPYLKTVIGVWILSCNDTYPGVASAARQAFQAAFPEKKQKDVLVFCKQVVVEYMIDNLCNQTAATLSDPKTTEEEEREAKYQRVLSSSLKGLRQLLQTLPSSDLEGIKGHLQGLLNDGKFWKLAKSPVHKVQSDLFFLLGSLCQVLPDLAHEYVGKLSPLVLGNIDNANISVIGGIWTAVLSLVKFVPTCWQNINWQKAFWPKLRGVLENGCQTAPSIVAPNILPLLSCLPVELGGGAKVFYPKLLEHAKLGVLKGITGSDFAFAVAYVECLQFALKEILSKEPSATDVAESLFLEQLEALVEASLLESTVSFHQSTVYDKVASFVTFVEQKADSVWLSSLFWERLTLAVQESFDTLDSSGDRYLRSDRLVAFVKAMLLAEKGAARNMASEEKEKRIVERFGDEELSSLKKEFIDKVMVQSYQGYRVQQRCEYLKLLADLADLHFPVSSAELLAKALEGESSLDTLGSMQRLLLIEVWKADIACPYVSIVQKIVLPALSGDGDKKPDVDTVDSSITLLFACLAHLSYEHSTTIWEAAFKSANSTSALCCLLEQALSRKDSFPQASLWLCSPHLTSCLSQLITAVTAHHNLKEDEIAQAWTVISLVLSASDKKEPVFPRSCIEQIVIGVHRELLQLSAMRLAPPEAQRALQFVARASIIFFQSLEMSLTLPATKDLMLALLHIDLDSGCLKDAVTEKLAREAWCCGVDAVVANTGGFVNEKGVLQKMCCLIQQAAINIPSFNEYKHVMSIVELFLQTASNSLPVDEIVTIRPPNPCILEVIRLLSADAMKPYETEKILHQLCMDGQISSVMLEKTLEGSAKQSDLTRTVFSSLYNFQLLHYSQTGTMRIDKTEVVPVRESQVKLSNVETKELEGESSAMCLSRKWETEDITVMLDAVQVLCLAQICLKMEGQVDADLLKAVGELERMIVPNLKHLSAASEEQIIRTAVTRAFGKGVAASLALMQFLQLLEAHITGLGIEEDYLLTGVEEDGPESSGTKQSVCVHVKTLQQHFQCTADSQSPEDSSTNVLQMLVPLMSADVLLEVLKQQVLVFLKLSVDPSSLDKATGCLHMVVSCLTYLSQDKCEQAVQQVVACLAHIKDCRDAADNLFLFACDMSKKSSSYFSFNTGVMQCMIVLVCKGHKVITPDLWDFILCSLVSWTESLIETKLSLSSAVSVKAFAVAACRLMAMVTRCIHQQLPTDRKAFPPNLEMEWKEFFSEGLFSALLPLFVRLVEEEGTKEQQQRSHVVFTALGGALCQCPKENIVDHKLPPKYLACEDTSPLPDSLQSLLNHLCPLLTHTLRAVQVTACALLERVMEELPGYEKEQKADDGQKEEVSRSPPVMLMKVIEDGAAAMDIVLSDVDIETCVAMVPGSEEYQFALGYLLAWQLALTFFHSASSELRAEYAAYFKENKYVEHLLNHLFRLMLHSPAALMPRPCVETSPRAQLPSLVTGKSPGRVSMAETTEADSSFTSSETSMTPEENGCVEEVQRLACHVYTHCLQVLPALVRQWWKDLDRKSAAYVDKFTSKNVSPYLCKTEIQSVQEMGSSIKDITVKACRATREVTATYQMEEVNIELQILLPENYPLGKIAVSSQRRVGVNQSEWDRWLLQLNVFLQHQNGGIMEGLRLWKRNIDKRFEGVEECMVCYAVVHGTNFQLPRVQCRTCKKKFHSACLYKWFSTSQNSTCPLCRNLF